MASTAETLLILEPNANGHRMRYVRRIAENAVARNRRVSVATSDSGTLHDEYIQLPESVERLGGTLPNPSSGRRLAEEQVRLLLAYRHLAAAKQAGINLVPFGDAIDKAAAVFGLGSGKWDLLLMRTFFHHQAMGIVGAPAGRSSVVKEALFRLLISRGSVRRVYTIDELLPLYAKRQGWRHAEKIRFVPDPPHVAPPGDRIAGRSLWSISEASLVVLVYGSLTPRKGIEDLVRAASSAGGRHIVLLLAGRQSLETKALLDNPAARQLREEGRLIEEDRYVDEAVESQAFAAADVVWLGYQNFLGSSGVLVQAAQSDRAVVACPEGLVGWRTREFGLGSILQNKSAEAVVTAVESAAQLYDSASTAKRLNFAQANSETAFAEAFFSS